MAYQDIGNGGVGNGPFGPTAGGGTVPGIGGGPREEVGQLLELRGQIDQRLVELGVPPQVIASPEIAPPMTPPMPPMDPSMAGMGGGAGGFAGPDLPPGIPQGNPMGGGGMPPGLLGPY